MSTEAETVSNSKNKKPFQSPLCIQEIDFQIAHVIPLQRTQQKMIQRLEEAERKKNSDPGEKHSFH